MLVQFIGCENAKNVTITNQVNQPVTWNRQSAGVWQTQVFQAPEDNLLNATPNLPKFERIEQLGEVSMPSLSNEIEASYNNGKVMLRFPLDEDEQIYGMGLHFRTVQQRQRILRLHVDHYGGRDDGRTHAPVPFFVSSKGYGVLINSARYIDAYIGTGVRKEHVKMENVRDRNVDKNWEAMPYSDNMEFVIPGEGVELVFFAGKDMMEVVQRFNLYCGGGFIPPKWGLGFWQRTPTLYSHEDVKKEVDAFKEKGFPLDVIGLEPGWHSKAYPCTFEWSPKRFPNPAGFVEEMNQEKVKLNLWCNPYLWPGSDIDKRMSAYTGSHTVWNGTVPDYTIPEAQNIMQEHMNKHQLDMGVSGYKIDEVDGVDKWLFPDVASFPSGHDGEYMRQVYGNLVMQLTDEMYRNKNTRTYGLIRAANAGSVKYPYVLYNDFYSHRGFIMALINSGFNGVLWTPEVRSGGSAEDWLRRMQTVCFSPLAMINAWADGTKPWTFEEVYDKCQGVALLRMQLLPYLYSTFADYYFTGRPPFYAINLLEGNNSNRSAIIKGQLDGTENPYAENKAKEITDQYMMGASIMVAPFFYGKSKRDVVLPNGNWYDFYTGEYVGNNELITIKSELDKIPLFVKDGAIIPMIPPIRQTAQWKGQPLELRVYGMSNGSFVVYDDDGQTYDYEKGAFSQVEVKVSNGIASIGDIPDSNWTYSDVSWKFMNN